MPFCESDSDSAWWDFTPRAWWS